MTGRPVTKARREREAAAASRRPVKPEVKREALQLAEEVGPAEAARRTGQKASTIRMWKTRAAQAAKPRAKATPQAGSSAGESTSESVSPTTRAEKLRARAEKAREAEFRAEDRADAQIGKNQSAEARNSMVSANSFSERAAELEESARLQELHEVALSEAQGRLVLDLVGSVFDDVSLPRPDGLLQARLQAWPGDPNPELVAQARDEVRRVIAQEVRAELAEAETERLARPGLPAGETESDDVAPDEEIIDAEVVEEPPPGDDDSVSWADLPEEWKSRYNLQPELGLYEYAQALKAEEIRARQRQPRVSAPGRFDPARFSHPGLSGGP
jgi:hypothetical protein